MRNFCLKASTGLAVVFMLVFVLIFHNHAYAFVISNKVELKYSLSYWFHTGLFGLIICSVGFTSDYFVKFKLKFS
jgi:hypothetical protein